MTDFKKWFAARARNPDKIPLEEAFAAGARSQPAPSFADAYQGAMEEVAIWKKRALEAEDLNRKFAAEINGPTYMGEPAHPKPDCGEAGHDEGRCGNRQCLPGAQPAPSVPEKITSVESGFKGMFLREAQAYKQGWNECRAAMLAAAPEAKP